MDCALHPVTIDLHHVMIELYLISVLRGQVMHGQILHRPDSVCSCALLTRVVWSIPGG